MPTVLITGANRGLGLGFVNAYLAGGWRVIAAVRDPAGAADLNRISGTAQGMVTVERCDLEDFTTIEGMGRKLSGTPIDVLLANAALTTSPASGVGDTDYDAWMRAFKVNTMAQMKLAETLVENVAASGRKTMYFVSSRIGAKPPAGMILFRSSKSALNQVVMQLSLLLKDRGIIVACGHPGFVKTKSTADMGVFTADESAGYLKKIIDGLTLDKSGQFFEPDGSTLPIVTRQMSSNAFGAKPPDAWDAQQKARAKDAASEN
ncbi:MAG: SDR family NAD(P)-dependent oxidoreductase [Rhodobacteraceae bacterium]|nr:SDR family NAD(P)-dependent oxidoreductase [Paracoccaceae bacterium]